MVIKMFNKDKFKDYINRLKLNKDDFIIVAGGSLLLQDIKDFTEDVDLYVNKNGFDILSKLFVIRPSGKEYGNHFTVNDHLEIVLKDNLDEMKYILIDGYKCTTLEYEYEWKKKHNRPKDQEIIKKMEMQLRKDDNL